jgi:hypothetical protein
MDFSFLIGYLTIPFNAYTMRMLSTTNRENNRAVASVGRKPKYTETRELIFEALHSRDCEILDIFLGYGKKYYEPFYLTTIAAANNYLEVLIHLVNHWNFEAPEPRDDFSPAVNKYLKACNKKEHKSNCVIS